MSFPVGADFVDVRPIRQGEIICRESGSTDKKADEGIYRGRFAAVVCTDEQCGGRVEVDVYRFKLSKVLYLYELDVH